MKRKEPKLFWFFYIFINIQDVFYFDNILKMIDIKVVGHKSPDTDCVCSAIIFADYLNKKWYDAIAYKQWTLNNETAYLLSNLNIKSPEFATSFGAWTKVALVDHNEKSQSLDNIDELDIEYIIDHHKIDFSTSEPINIRAEKVCSTASVLYKMYKENWVEISKTIWILILASILSDSLLFRSVTTTKEDILLAKELSEITWITDFDDFMKPLFDAKSDLWNMSIEELIKYDYKEFEVNWKKIGIWTLETTNPNYALWRKSEILAGLKDIKNASNLDFILLSIVDIFGEKNISIVLDWYDTEVVEKVFKTQVKDNLIDLKNRLSRKKQIAPDLTNFFSN